MLTFDDFAVLDPEYAPNARGGPEFSTAVIVGRGGITYRNSNRYDAIGRWSINYDLLRDDQLAGLAAFFRARRGRARGFRFRAPEDNTAVDEQIGTGDGSNIHFYLKKNYEPLGNVDVRRIVKPVQSTVVIKVNGVISNQVFTINHATGEVQFSSPPASGASVTWSGTFDVPAVFGSDSFQSEIDTGGVSGWGVEIVEILPADLGIYT